MSSIDRFCVARQPHDSAHYAIFDLAHATGADASAVDALLEAARLVQATHRREVPALYACGRTRPCGGL